VKFHHQQSTSETVFSLRKNGAVQVHFVLVAFNDLSKSFSFPCPPHCYRFIARFRISKLTQSYLRAASINSRSCYFEFIGKKTNNNGANERDRTLLAATHETIEINCKIVRVRHLHKTIVCYELVERQTVNEEWWRGECDLMGIWGEVWRFWRSLKVFWKVDNDFEEVLQGTSWDSNLVSNKNPLATQTTSSPTFVFSDQILDSTLVQNLAAPLKL
jgi:hypothetical protein